MKRYSPLILILVLLGALGISQAASAATPALAPTAPTLTNLHHVALDDEEEGEEFEFEDEEEEFEACEASAEEFEFEDEEEEFEEEEWEIEEDEEECEEEISKKGKNSPFVTAPVACQVRRAESTITTLPGSDQVRLTVHYLTYAPTRVTIGLKLKDHKGSVGIEHTSKHMGSHGTIQITTRLGSAVMERALKATEFDVALRAPETPGYCADALEQQLRSAKHTGANAPRVYAN